MSAQNLLQNSLAPSSVQCYKRVIAYYTHFLSIYFPGARYCLLPASMEQLSLFIAFCYHNELACSTVQSYMSVISYLHKLNGFKDLSQSFVIKKSLEGLRKVHGASDTRLPITYSILQQLVNSLKHTCNSFFERVLLKAMYLVAFYAFLRIGEITQTNTAIQNNIKFQEIQFLFDKGASVPNAFELHMRHFKHNVTKSSHILLIKESSENHIHVCPVHALWDYCKLRGTHTGTLFCFMNGDPISRQFFNQHLKYSLIWCGLSTERYKGHSFRIGAASFAFEKGFSDERIQFMGRWKSNAYKKYIRAPVLKV